MHAMHVCVACDACEETGDKAKVGKAHIRAGLCHASGYDPHDTALSVNINTDSVSA